MKFILGIALLAIIWTTPALSDEKNSTIENQCSGPWELKNYGGWYVHGQNGTILPISADSRLLDCLQNEAQLTPSLDGEEVLVECQITREGQTIPDVKNIILICR